MEAAMFLVRMNGGSTYEKPNTKSKTSFHHKPKAQPQSPSRATPLQTACCLCYDAPYLPKSVAHFSSPSVSTGCPRAPLLAVALSPCCSFGLPLTSTPPRGLRGHSPGCKASSDVSLLQSVFRASSLQWSSAQVYSPANQRVQQAMALGWKQGYCLGTHLSWAQIMPANPTSVYNESKHFLPSKRFPEPHFHLQHKCTWEKANTRIRFCF